MGSRQSDKTRSCLASSRRRRSRFERSQLCASLAFLPPQHTRLLQAHAERTTMFTVNWSTTYSQPIL